VLRLGAGAEPVDDAVAIEEPLEIRIGGRSFVVTMRTPGDDDALTAGLLASERIVRTPAELVRIAPCPNVPPESADNVVDVVLSEEAPFRWGARRFAVTSACGLCGKERIEEIRNATESLADDPARIDFATLLGFPARLRERQAAFEHTGGLHAAALAGTVGEIDDSAEDVGRHNAVDKVLGRAFRAGAWPLRGRVLLVSGRASFEIVQKAAVAGVPIVAAVSAPSSLAIDLAVELGMTLVGFLRDGRANVYAGAERVTRP